MRKLALVLVAASVATGSVRAGVRRYQDPPRFCAWQVEAVLQAPDGSLREATVGVATDEAEGRTIAQAAIKEPVWTSTTEGQMRSLATLFPPSAIREIRLIPPDNARCY